jgi:hypothetical protein
MRVTQAATYVKHTNFVVRYSRCDRGYIGHRGGMVKSACEKRVEERGCRKEKIKERER